MKNQSIFPMIPFGGEQSLSQIRRAALLNLNNHHQQSRKHNRLSCKKRLRRLFSSAKGDALLAKVLQKCHHNDGSQLSRKEALAICKNFRIARYVDLVP